MTLTTAGRLLLTVIVLAFFIAACGDEEEENSTGTGESIVEPGSNPSPEAGNLVEDQIEERTLTISGGELAEDQLTLTLNQPVVIHVVNEDDQAYRMEIPEYLTSTEIAPSATTDVAFTMPVAADVEGKLLPPGEGDPIATFRVLVQEAGGVQP